MKPSRASAYLPSSDELLMCLHIFPSSHHAIHTAMASFALPCVLIHPELHQIKKFVVLEKQIATACNITVLSLSGCDVTG